MASKGGCILHRRFVYCCSGGRRGNTEQVFARWQRLVAFIKALDLLHQSMRVVLHRHTSMAIEKASDGGTFVRCRRLVRLIKT